MKKRITQTFVIIGLLANSALNAQVYTLDNLLDKAFAQNLGLKNSYIDSNSTEFKRDEIAAGRLPQITLSGDYRYNAIIPGQVIPASAFGGPPGVYNVVKFGFPWNLGTTATATQILFNPQVSYGLKVADIANEISGLQIRKSKEEIVFNVSSTYYSIQAVDQNMLFINNNITSLTSIIAKTQSIKDAGLAKSTDVDRLKVQKMSLDSELEQLKSTRSQLINLMKLLCGINPNEALDIASQVDETVGNVNETAQKRTDMQLLESQLLLTQAEKNSIRNSYLPTLVAYAAYNLSIQARTGTDAVSKAIPAAFVGIKLEWTLFDGLAKVHKNKQNKIATEKIANQQAQLSQNTQYELSNATLVFSAASSVLSTALESEKLSQKIYDQTEAQLKAGVVSTTDLLQTQTELQKSQSTVAAAYLAMRNAELAYRQAAGLLLTNL